MADFHDADDAAFEARKLAFAQTVPDYADVFDTLAAIGKDPAIPPHVAEFLKTSPVGIALGYRLAKRLDLIDWILGLAPEPAIEVLTYIASNFQLEPSPPSLDLGWLHPWIISLEEFWRLVSIEYIETEMRLAKLHTWAPSSGSRPH